MSVHMSSTSRARIISARRPLLPPKSSVCLNPSSKPADIQIREPAVAENHVSSDAQKYRQERSRPVTIECDFSNAPQPFLDPDVWNRMRRQAQELTPGFEDRSSGDLEERERRKEREAEYGGLAIQGRATRRKKG